MEGTGDGRTDSLSPGFVRATLCAASARKCASLLRRIVSSSTTPCETLGRRHFASPRAGCCFTSDWTGRRRRRRHQHNQLVSFRLCAAARRHFKRRDQYKRIIVSVCQTKIKTKKFDSFVQLVPHAHTGTAGQRRRGSRAASKQSATNCREKLEIGEGESKNERK